MIVDRVRSITSLYKAFRYLRWHHPDLKCLSAWRALLGVYQDAKRHDEPLLQWLPALQERCKRKVTHLSLEAWVERFQPVIAVQTTIQRDSPLTLWIGPTVLSDSDVTALFNAIKPLKDEDWLLFLANTDQLPLGFVDAIESQLAHMNDASVVTLDEWCIDGEKVYPLCKPEWDPQMLWAKPYLGRGLLVRKGVFLEHQGFPTEQLPVSLDALVDSWALRWSMQPEAAARTRRITSWPVIRVGYSAPSEGPESRVERLEALFREHSKPSRVVGRAPKVTLIVPTRNALAVLKPCVESLLTLTDYPDFELIVIDNQSDCPETLAYLHALPERDGRARVLNWPHAFNYAAINNFGVQHAQGDWVCLVNNDIEATHPEWLTEMMHLAVLPESGCIGAKLLYPDGRIQHGGVVLGVGGVAGHSHRFESAKSAGYMQRLQVPQRYSAVTGACLLVRKAYYEQVGGLDAEAFPINYNDTDLCLKLLQKGYTNLWTPKAVLIHHESVSRGRGARGLKRRRALSEAKRFKRKWPRYIENDRAYHPDLSPFAEDFSLNPLHFGEQ
ncbi:MAG: glycosyltransferase family 2 protein [Saccharospirillum sp.]|nr:glycosyltransferase family 2 protein [Saccharospirillum sp.]